MKRLIQYSPSTVNNLHTINNLDLDGLCGHVVMTITEYQRRGYRRCPLSYGEQMPECIECLTSAAEELYELSVDGI